MFKKLKYLFKNVGIMTISQFSSKILVFFLIPLYTSVLTTAEYGVYDMSITIVELLFPLLTINIVDAVMRFLLDKNCKQKEVISIASKYLFFGIIISGLIVLGVALLDIFPEIRGLEIYIFLYFAFYVTHQFIVQAAKGLERIGHIGITGVIGTVSLITFNLLFLLVFKWGLKGFFIANVLAQLIPTLYLMIAIRVWKYIGKGGNKEVRKQMIAYCFPLIVNTLVWWANSAADKFTVTLMVGVAANGLLSIAYKIPNILSIVQGIFNQGWQLSAIKEFSEKDDSSFFNKVVLLVNTVMCVGASALILLTKYVAKFMFANDFYNAWIFVPLLVVAVVINTNSGIYGAIFSAKKKSKSLAVISLVGIVANVGLNILFVYLMGTQGAVIATVASTFVIYILRKIVLGKAYSTSADLIVHLSFIILCVQSCMLIYFEHKLAMIVNAGLFVLMVMIYALVWRKPLLKGLKAFLRWGRRVLHVILYRVFAIFPIKNNKIFIVSYNGKDYGDNGKYIANALLASGKNYQIVWSVKNLETSVPDKVRKVKYLSLKAIYHEVTAKVWIDNCRKENWVRKRKGQFYIQTWHGDIALKRIEKDVEVALSPLYVKNAVYDSKMADLFVSGNDWMSELYHKSFWYNGEIAKVGYPRRDILYNNEVKNELKEKLNIDKDTKVLLYAPTFRKKQLEQPTPDLSVYKLPWDKVLSALETRFGGKWVGVIRLHPAVTKMAKDLQLPQNVIDLTNYPDMQELLAVADVCISDYSSSFMEFSVTGKPSFIYATDYDDYKADRDTYFEFEELPFKFAQTEQQLVQNVLNFDDEEFEKLHEQFYTQRLKMYEEGNASNQIAQIIERKCFGQE